MNNPCLFIVIPCYNEEETLPVTVPLFLEELESLEQKKLVSENSRILFVDDGSADGTWTFIRELSAADTRCRGISLSRNQGHQNALLAGMMEAKDSCDIVITIDCDGQDDISAMESMVREYLGGCEIVYGVRDDRSSDSFFKRNTARGYYRLMQRMGAELIYDHADYRLVSSKALDALSQYHEVNLFLRGMFPLVGFRSTCVRYKRQERAAGQTRYPLRKMLHLAIDGITSLSIRPITMIAGIGAAVSLLGFAGVIWAIAAFLLGHTVSGWASIVCIVCFLGGIQLLSLGIIGEYVGKTYLETKARPRYIVADKTGQDDDPGSGE